MHGLGGLCPETVHLGAAAIAGALGVGLAPKVARLLTTLHCEPKLGGAVSAQYLRYLLLAHVASLRNTTLVQFGGT